MKNLPCLTAALAVTALLLTGCESTVEELHFDHVALASGVNLHYAEQGDTRGEAIIFLHGFTDSWHSYALVLPLLPDTYHALALDLRGHGGSSKPKCCYTLDEFTDDVLAFMSMKGIGQATLVGHSMGSFIAQRVALAAPDRVRRLVLIGSTARAHKDGTSELDRTVATMTDPIDPDFVRDFQTGTLYGSVPHDFLDTVVSESLRVPAHVWRGALAGLTDHDTTAELPQMQTPTLNLWGDQDEVFPLADQELLDELVPDLTFKVYEKTGHGLHWEQPERFIEDLLVFIDVRP